MVSSADFDDSWSDASIEDEIILPTLQPRAYQIEMFQQSMRQNTIVTVSTSFGLWFDADVGEDGDRERQDDDSESAY